MRAGNESRIKRTNMRHCVLFNDVLMLFKEEAKGKLTFKNDVPLAAAVLRDAVADGLERDGPGGGDKYVFHVVGPKKTFVLLAASVDAKRRWMDAIARAVWRLTPPDLRVRLGWRHQLVVGTLHSAALAGDDAMVRTLLTLPPPRVVDDDSEGGGDLPESDDAETLDVDAMDTTGLTALHCAAYTGHSVVIDALLAAGASVNMRARDGSTPLHMAAARCNPDAVRALVSNGGSVVAKDARGATPLLAAINCGSEAAALPMASVLIDYGSDVNAASERGTCVLHVVVALGYPSLALLLARSGARVLSLCVPPAGVLGSEGGGGGGGGDGGGGDGDRMTALHLACSLPVVSVAVVSALLKVCGAQRGVCCCCGCSISCVWGGGDRGEGVASAVASLAGLG